MEALVFKGELSTFRDQGDSGQLVLRQFCGHCGSPIRTLAAILPGLAVLKAGTLDETPPQAPDYALYAVHAVDWELRGLECVMHERMPVAAPRLHG